MGRVKPTKMTGKFFLRTDRKPKDEKYSIYLDYTLGTKHAKTDTGIWVEEQYWDATKREVKKTHFQCVRLNKELQNKRETIDNNLFDYIQQTKGRITIDVLRSIVQGQPIGKVADSDFITYATETIVQSNKIGKIGVAVKDNALCSFRLFRKFLCETTGEDSIFISELTVDIVKEYIIWRKGRGNTNATINKTITPIIRTAERAVIDKLLDASIVNAIRQLYLPTNKELGEEDDDEVHYLTKEQVEQFISLREEVKYPRTKDFMDMFLFSLNACGLRVSDLITLEWRSIDFEKKTLRKVLFKGDKTHEIPLNDDAIKLLEKWHLRTGDHRFVFGLLDDEFNMQDKEERKRMRLNKNRAIITSLKTIGDKMNIKDFNLTMHVARHTFAVWALNKGVDVHVISRLLGHSSIMVTEKVYAKFLPSTLEKEVQEKLNFNLLKRG